MKQFEVIYEENKKLDTAFEEQYDVSVLILRENLMSLLTELAELANETRCFKYWSSKGPSDKSIILEEYADCMLMVLMYFNYLDVSLDENFDIIKEENINDQFITLFGLCSHIKDNYNKTYIKKVFSHLITLGRSLNFSDDDIIKGCLNKIRIVNERLDVTSNY